MQADTDPVATGASTADTRALLRPLWWASASIFLFLAAALAWAYAAEIATTIRVSGLIRSTTPSFTVQHPDGGRVTQVFVKPHQSVAAGDLILQLDVTDFATRLDGIEEQIAYLNLENHALRTRLDLHDPSAGTPEYAIHPRRQAEFVEVFMRERLAEDSRLRAYELSLTAAREKRVAAEQEREALVAVHDLLKDRLAAEEQLADKGSLAVLALDVTRERVFLTESEIAALGRDIAAIDADIRQAEISAELYVKRARKEDGDKLTTNLKAVAELITERQRLKSALKRAKVTAPVAGVISSLKITTPDAVLRAGATIATISRPLADPIIRLRIPPQHVDQVRPGQGGIVMLDSLSARAAPKLSVKITGMSSEAVLDEEGKPQYYEAEARIEPADLEKARAQLGERFHLALDMPTTALLNGRPTTFLGFLLAPLKNLKQGVLQSE